MYPVLAPETSSFKKLAKAGIFVDKSQAIADFLKQVQPIYLLLRPHRSGKTTLLQMFLAFLKHRKNPAETEMLKELFLQNNLGITKDACFEKEFGRYPVIYLDFSNVGYRTYDDLVEGFKEKVVAVAEDLEKCGYLGSQSDLTSSERTFLNDLLNRNLAAPQWTTALQKLTKFVHDLTDREVVVLVDGYDTPMSGALRRGYLEEANGFFRNIFSPLLKDNEHLRGALLVGVLPLAKASWLSGVDNLTVFPLHSTTEYSTSCMFTRAEAEHLYNRQNHAEGLPFTFDDLDSWYNGYGAPDGTRLYNPWSIGQALVRKRLDFYWAESSYDRVIEQRVSQMLSAVQGFRAMMADLLEGRTITFAVGDTTLTFLCIQFSPRLRVSTMSMSELWTLIHYAGYTTIAPSSASSTDFIDSDNTEGEDSEIDSEVSHDSESDSESVWDGNKYNGVSGFVSGETITVRIPNVEIRSVFCRWLNAHLAKSIKMANMEGLGIKLFDAMITGSLSAFAKRLGRTISQTTRFPLFGSKEQVYPSFLSAFVTAVAFALDASPKWEVVVERCGGRGFLDLHVRRATDTRAVIQAYQQIGSARKEGSQRKRLAKTAFSALKRIEVLGYRSCVADHVTELHEYGVAVLGAYCAVVGRSLYRRKAGRRWRVTKTYSDDDEMM